jgi:hypothetical protein
LGGDEQQLVSIEHQYQSNRFQYHSFLLFSKIK